MNYPEHRVVVTSADLMSGDLMPADKLSKDRIAVGELPVQPAAWPYSVADSSAILSKNLNRMSSRELPSETYLRRGVDVAAIREQLATLSNPIEFLANLFANSPLGLGVFKTDGRMLLVNRAMTNIFDSKPPPDYNIFLDNLAIELGIDIAARKAFAGETISIPTFWYDPRELKSVVVIDGRRVAVSMWMFPILNVQGDIEYVGAIYRDDTPVTLERLQLEAQSEQLEQHILSRTAELEEANEELEAFSYSVSHDLRAPLRSIDALAEIIASDTDSQLSAQAQECLDRLRSATARMNNLVADLLSFSRLGKQALRLSNTSPQMLIEQVLEELKARLQSRSVDFEIGELPECQADPALLREVFLNLLDNAIKFTGKCAHARIKVTAQLQEGQWIWSVSDNGVGFDMTQYPRLFGVFSRLHSGNEFEGTGVGLALVRRIVKRHGGDIWAESEENRGTTFFFTLGTHSAL